MRLIATVVVGLVVGCGPATGGPDGGRGPGPIGDPGLTGLWEGESVWHWGDLEPTTHADRLSVEVYEDGSMLLGDVCFAPRDSEDRWYMTMGTDGTWEGEIVCAQRPYASCGTGVMVITHHTAEVSAATDLSTFAATFTGEGTHCGVTRPMAVEFTGRR